MAKREFDVVVIGSGPGGYVAAIRAAQLGLKTACIEKNKTLGGTCLNVGCIPSKALLQTTEYYDLIQHDLKEHGIAAKDVSLDFAQMMQRKSKIVKLLVDSIDSHFKRVHVERINGMVRLIDSHMVEVDTGTEKRKIEAENIILATGSEAIPLPFLPFDEKTILSSTGTLALPSIPKKMIMVGAGVIGVELASVFNRLGTKVTIVEMLDRITPPMDAAVSKTLQQILRKQGLEFYLGAKVTKGQVTKDGATLTVLVDDKEQVFSADVILVAIGRRPYTQGLGLKEAGVNVSPKGLVEVDSYFRTSQKNIYAIGDVIDGPMLAHKASDEGMVVAEIIAGQHPQINYMSIPNVIYTHPEVAAVGMTEEEARDAGLELKIGICQFKANARARCVGYTDGMVKLIGDSKSGRLVGMHIIGAQASEMIGEGVMAITKGMTLEEIANASHAHPTLNEAIKEAAEQALGRAIHIT